MSRPMSLLFGTDSDALNVLLPVHAPPDPLVLDCTYGGGRMWKKAVIAPDVRTDKDPSLDVDVAADFRQLPFEDASFDVIVFDPPHWPGNISASSIYNQRYNTPKFTDGREKDTVVGLFPSALAEFKRLLKPNAIVLVKIADLVRNHKYQWQHVALINEAVAVGLTPCDMLIKVDPCAGNLKSSKWKNVKHLRKQHCFWVVLRNGPHCERKD